MYRAVSPPLLPKLPPPVRVRFCTPFPANVFTTRPVATKYLPVEMAVGPGKYTVQPGFEMTILLLLVSMQVLMAFVIAVTLSVPHATVAPPPVPGDAEVSAIVAILGGVTVTMVLSNTDEAGGRAVSYRRPL